MDTPSVPQKQCKTCQQWKPATPKYYRFKGVWSENECRQCFNLRRNDQRRTPTTKLQNRRDEEGYKVCGGCDKRLPWTEEYFHKRGKRLTSRCKECRNSHHHAYYQLHTDHKAEYARNYRKRNPEKVAANNKRWQANNPKRRCMAVLRYQRAHPEVKRASEAKRRALKLGNGGTHTGADIRLLIKSQKGRCWWCGKKLDKYEVDHRIPLSRGGSNAAENLCITCPRCNAQKHDKLPSEWNGRLL